MESVVFPSLGRAAVTAMICGPPSRMSAVRNARICSENSESGDTSGAMSGWRISGTIARQASPVAARSAPPEAKLVSRCSESCTSSSPRQMPSMIAAARICVRFGEPGSSGGAAAESTRASVFESAACCANSSACNCIFCSIAFSALSFCSSARIGALSASCVCDWARAAATAAARLATCAVSAATSARAEATSRAVSSSSAALIAASCARSDTSSG